MEQLATTRDSAPRAMSARKQIALIAHDNRKPDLLEWARFNRDTLAEHELFATGTTGALLGSALGLAVHRYLSGPLGGDQQVGAAIACNRATADFVLSSPLMGSEYRRVPPAV